MLIVLFCTLMNWIDLISHARPSIESSWRFVALIHLMIVIDFTAHLGTGSYFNKNSLDEFEQYLGAMLYSQLTIRFIKIS